MAWIKSKVIPNTRWEIKREIYWRDPVRKRGRMLRFTPEIAKKDREFIENLNLVLYCNDLTGEEWAFDVRLPAGGYIENIRALWAKDGTRVFRATILT